VPIAERGPIIRRYLTLSLGARPHISISWRAPLAAFEGIASNHPVFRITSATNDQTP
jgi:hypothetical protein